MAGMLAIAGPVLGIGSSVAGLMGGGSGNASNVALPPMWQMPGMGDAAGGALGGTSGLAGMNYAGQNYPQFQSAVSDIQNNPGAQRLTSGAQEASSYGYGAGRDAIQGGQFLNQAGGGYVNAGQSLIPYAQSLPPYMQQILQQSFDPQNALYGRTQQQLQDQTRAGLEARGVNSTPYGAGVEGQTMSNFNIDWQNNLLQRMIGGAGGANTLAGATNTLMGAANNAGTTGANLMGAGNNMQQSGVGMLNSSAYMPYSAFNTIGQNNLGALSGLNTAGGQAAAIPQQTIDDYLRYIAAGNQAGGVANNTAKLGLDQANMAFNQGQTLGNNLGASMSGLGRALNTMNGTPTNLTGWGTNTGTVGGTGAWF